MVIKKSGLYDLFDNLDEIKVAYKNCRTTKYFIMTDEWIEKNDPICVGCNKKFSKHISTPGFDGNRGDYYPKSKKIEIRHYVCAWKTTLAVIESY